MEVYISDFPALPSGSRRACCVVAVHGVNMKLLEDIVIPAGTLLQPAPHKTTRSSNHWIASVALSDDVTAFFEFCPDDLTEEEVSELME